MRELSAGALVALGGATGALMRYYAGLWIARGISTGFPAGTLAINLSGCLAIGATLALADTGHAPAWLRPLVVVGVLGGYTTFSSYAAETLALARNGAVAAALAYVAFSNVLGLAAAVLGWQAARQLLH